MPLKLLLFGLRHTKQMPAALVVEVVAFWHTTQN